MDIGGGKRKPVIELWPRVAAGLVISLTVAGCEVDPAPVVFAGSGTAIAIDGTPVQCVSGSAHMTYDQLPKDGGKVFDIDSRGQGIAAVTQYANQAAQGQDKEQADYTAYYDATQLYPTPYSVIKGDGNLQSIIDQTGDVDQATMVMIATIYQQARQACEAKFGAVSYNRPAFATVTFG